MSIILPFLKRYRLPIGIALALMLVELSIELSLPLLLAIIIDNGIMQGDLQTIFKWGSVMIALSFISVSSGVINAFYASHVSQSTGFAIRNRLFTKIQRFSFAQLQRFPTSSLITRMTNDVTQIQQTIYLSLGILVRAPLRVVGGAAMAFVVHPRLALFLVATLPFLVVFLIWMKKIGSTLFARVQEKLDGVNHVIRENLMAMRLIKLFVRRKYEDERFEEKNRDLMSRTVTVLRIMELTMPVLLLLMNLSVIGVLWLGSTLFSSGGAQVGEVVAVVNYTMRITSALTVFSMMITVLSRAQASSKRIEEVLEIEVDEGMEETSSLENVVQAGTVEFDRVSFHYPDSSRMIIKECSFHINAGERVAILGATGAGKTTLVQLIPRLYEVSDGHISIDGQKVKEMDVIELRNQIGYVPQEVLLFSGSVKENIAWGKKDATLDEMIEAAKDAQIHETIMKLPQQYDTKIGQKGVNLSGGQKQRIAIARALIRKPRILLLDDSTSALDVNTEANLLKALSNYSCTTLIITQKVSTASEADSIILMDHGQIMAIGKHKQLLRESQLYEQIYESQFLEEEASNAR